MDNRIPLSIEQAMDLILALPAHRASNEKHASFGKMLIEEYFIKLRQFYSNDSVAYTYLNNVFAAIAAAVRGFSVQREIFQTRCNTFEQLKNQSIEKAKRLDKYSPFNGGIGKIISFIASLGASGIIVKPKIDGLSSITSFAFLVPVSFIVFLFIIDFLIELYRHFLIKKAEKAIPDKFMEVWQNQNLIQYKKILKNFLLNGIDIQESFYPDSTVFGSKISDIKGEGRSDIIDKIIERHIAL